MIFYIIVFTALFFAVIIGIEYFRQRRSKRTEQEQNPFEEEDAHDPQQPVFGCCGKHANCELADNPRSFTPTIDYYDDEELDKFSGRTADSYTPEETALFREIVDTMQADDVKGWLFSLQQREIALPREIEALLRTLGKA